MGRRIVALVTAALVLSAPLAACGTAPDRATPAGTVPDTPASGDASPVEPASPSDTPAATASPSAATSPAPSARTPPPGVRTGDWAAALAVLDQINAWRTAAGLPLYTMLPGLVASAHRHNLAMAAGCGLSHRCPGEPELGDRIRAQDVRWSSVGENIGESGPHAGTTSAITGAAKGLDTMMYREKPPDDGHRRNLLSKSFTHIGIDVVRDRHGTVWLTQDFSN